MLLTELQTYSLTQLTNNPFSSATSADNSFAFITEKGLDVLELSPDPKSVSPSLSCRRYVIKPSSALPTEDLGINLGDLMCLLDKEDLYGLITDVTMAPRLPRTLPPAPNPRAVAWSPITLLPNQRCVLAVLTDAGSLCLYTLSHHEYRVVGDVSRLWLQLCRDAWAEAGAASRSPQEKLAEARRRADMVKITAMCWLEEAYGDVGEGWLAAGARSGLVTLWRVQAGQTPASDLAISLVTQFQTDLTKPTCLQWFITSQSNSMLNLGGLDGRVSCFALPPPRDINEPVIGLVQRHDVWPEADRIATIHMSCWSWADDSSSKATDGVSPATDVDSKATDGDSKATEGGLLLVVVKGAFVIALHLSNNGERLSYAAYRSCDTSVNGLTQLSKNQILMVTRSARFVQLTVSQCREGEGAGKIQLATDLAESYMNISHMGCYGLSLSRNKLICFILLSVNQSYDHLRLREPTQVVVCGLRGLSDPVSFLTDPQTPVAQLWDCLELIRVQVLQKVYAPQFCHPRSVLDTMSVDHLICLLWTVTFAVAVEDDEAKQQELVRLQSELETLVASCHYFKRTALLLASLPDSLTVFQLQSLGLLRKWLLKLITLSEEFSTTLITGKTLLQQLDSLDVKLPIDELCDICGSLVVGMPERALQLFSRCESGHMLPRCSLSLVQCSRLPYYTCAQCGCLAHPIAVDECGIACILCGGVLRLDEDIL